MSKKPVLLNASESLIARLDAATRQHKITRTAAIIRAIERYLPELERAPAEKREWSSARQR